MVVFVVLQLKAKTATVTTVGVEDYKLQNNLDDCGVNVKCKCRFKGAH